MGLRLEFGGNYNDSQKKKSLDIIEKISNVFSRFNISESDFFSCISSYVEGYYISTANFDRTPEDRNNQDKWVRNVFLRAKIDHYLSKKFKGNSFILIGTVVIKPRLEYSYFAVEDFFLCENTDKKSYEEYIDCPSNFQTIKNGGGDWNSRIINSVLNFDLLGRLPYIVDRSKFYSFFEKWKEYLEFENELTKMGINYKAIKAFEFLKVFEIKDSEENSDLFSNDIITRYDKMLYINSSSTFLSGNESKYVLVKIVLQKEENYRSFLNQKLALVEKKHLEKLEAMSRGEEIEDFPKIELGDYVSSLDIKNDTIEAYFFVPEAIDDDGDFDVESYHQDKQIKSENGYYLTNIVTGDIALYKRGLKALNDMEKGRVKNPFLAGLLVDPVNFETNVDVFKKNNIEFALERLLNESQKEAIIKCLNSNSIFCIQGPPGTGKTQTITELVYQYNKMGKKVLLSSQNHTAIDNVIERLPKEMNILPIRLVSDIKKVNRQYLPDKLLDNLYEAAYVKFKEKIDVYENFSKDIDKIEREYNSNKQIYDRIRKRESKCAEIKKRISETNDKIIELQEQSYKIEGDERKLEENQRFIQRFYDDKLSIDSITEDIKNDIFLSEFKKFAKTIGIKDEEENMSVYISLVQHLIGKKRINNLNLMLEGNLESPQELTKIEIEIEKTKQALKYLEEYEISDIQLEVIRKKLNGLLQEKKKILEATEFKVIDISNQKFYFAKKAGDPVEIINAELTEINKQRKNYENMVERVITPQFIKSLISKKIIGGKEGLKKEIEKNQIYKKQLESEESEVLTPIKNDKEKLDAYFNDFFLEKLNDNSLPIDNEEKFNRIKQYIKNKIDEFKQKEKEYKKYSFIYENTVKFLEDRKSFIDNQRKLFTKTLFTNNANVYGITCTASPFYRSNRNNYLKSLDIEDVDVSKEDFDVVIIDEVSKATPIEIMIPLLYGKSVVLVGDQRQLPPIFKYRESMFKDFDETLKQKLFKTSSLEEFKERVEYSLFEEIYNSLKTNRAMLNQQYRFNTKIMKCVNVFYEDALEAGHKKEQDNKKKHNLKVEYNGFDIFDPQKFTYWFNSHKYSDDIVAFEKTYGGRTSFYNDLEAKITFEILKLINKGYQDLSKSDFPAYEEASGEEKSKDNFKNRKPTVGIITMYGDQIKTIKNIIKDNNYKFDYINYDISTVDRYQGREQDIIIVNFVRNNKKGEAGEFIKKFNRINVAISRARNMLVVVGSKDFCSNLDINVPKMGSSEKNLLKAYGMIYDRCDIHYNHAAGMFDIKCQKGGNK